MHIRRVLEIEYNDQLVSPQGTEARGCLPSVPKSQSKHICRDFGMVSILVLMLSQVFRGKPPIAANY